VAVKLHVWKGQKKVTDFDEMTVRLVDEHEKVAFDIVEFSIVSDPEP
jgi:hypothetical protein